MCVAIYFQYITGCRPWEAAWVALHKGLRATTYIDLEQIYPTTVFMPLAATKTAWDYEWFIRKNQDWFVKILRQHKPPHIEQKLLAKQLDWWHNKVVRSAKQVLGMDGKVSICFRSVRRTHANEWYFYKTKCEAMNLEYIPNPLQHVSDRTISHYLDVVSNRKLKARHDMAQRAFFY